MVLWSLAGLVLGHERFDLQTINDEAPLYFWRGELIHLNAPARSRFIPVTKAGT